MRSGEDRCPAPGCKRKRDRWALLCRNCWQRSPEDLRRNIQDSPPGSQERREACLELLKWWAKDQPTLGI